MSSSSEDMGGIEEFMINHQISATHNNKLREDKRLVSTMASKEQTQVEESEPAPKAEPTEEVKSGSVEESTVDDSKPEATEDESEPPAASVQTTTPKEDEDAVDASKSKRVYVGNLAWEVSWQDLKDHMKSTGLDAKVANILTTPDGRSKGCGIVEFGTPKEAQEAVTLLNDTELRGRQIFVREDREEQRGPSSVVSHQPGVGGSGHQFTGGETAKNRRVYVGNLSWDVAWQDLKDHMREAGEVVHAEIIRENTGRSKGCGIVEFASEEDAQNAITTLTDTDLNGRMIFVREDRESSNQGSVTTGIRAQQNTSVYVWNLTPETSWQDLKDHMRKAGNVDSATILTNAQGESSCCGVVVYQRPQDAARAIRELQNSELRGQPIFVREDRVQQGNSAGGGGGRGRGRGRGASRGGRGGRGGGRGFRSEGSQVFVGNLSPDTTWRELKDHFRQCGEVNHAEVKTDFNGQSKGFGIVSFADKEEAETAISRLNGSELQGSELEVRLDQKVAR